MIFKIGKIWERTLPPAAAQLRAIAYVQERRADLWEWLNETTFLGDWRIEAILGSYEYDTGYCEYDVIIRYSDESDAVHHRLRW